MLIPDPSNRIPPTGAGSRRTLSYCEFDDVPGYRAHRHSSPLHGWMRHCVNSPISEVRKAFRRILAIIFTCMGTGGHRWKCFHVGSIRHRKTEHRLSARSDRISPTSPADNFVWASDDAALGFAGWAAWGDREFRRDPPVNLRRRCATPLATPPIMENVRYRHRLSRPYTGKERVSGILSYALTTGM